MREVFCYREILWLPIFYVFQVRVQIFLKVLCVTVQKLFNGMDACAFCNITGKKLVQCTEDRPTITEEGQ